MELSVKFVMVLGNCNFGDKWRKIKMYHNINNSAETHAIELKVIEPKG